MTDDRTQHPTPQADTNLPPGWAWTTIGEITQDVIKINPADNPDHEITYLDISSIDNAKNRITAPKTYLGKDAPSRARQLVSASDVLFSTVRTYLRNIALVPEQYDGQIASTGFSVLRGEEDVLGEYLFYFVLTDDFLEELGNLQRGVSYPAVRDADVRAQSIPLAPPPEQRRIVDAIETQFTRLDAAVAGLERLQANLARYRQSVLKAACEGRLVPTEAALAQAAGRSYEDGPTLLARILDERRQAWAAENPKKTYKEPSAPDVYGLSDPPRGWVWAMMEQVAEQRLGKMLDKAKNQGDLHPYIRNANVRWFSFDLSDVAEMRIKGSELADISVRSGDLVVCEGGEPGRAAVWEKLEGIAIQKALHRVRPFGGIEPWYVAYCLAADANTGVLAKYFTGSTIKHFTGQSLRSYIFALPPLAEQQRIVEEVERRLSVVDQHERVIAASLRRSARLRQAILKRAFSGRLV